MKIPVKDANARDDPMLYYYWVHVMELEKDKSHSKDKTAAREAEKDAKLIGSVMEVQCAMMRLANRSNLASIRLMLYLITVATACLFQNLFYVVSFETVSTEMLQWHHRGLSSQ